MEYESLNQFSKVRYGRRREEAGGGPGRYWRILGGGDEEEWREEGGGDEEEGEEGRVRIYAGGVHKGSGCGGGG
ncbi:MAG: hypothetical protein Q4B16_04485 [Bacteroidia bacterium]|nr:hypothetical protein [Bacteroidia bacterium]